MIIFIDTSAFYAHLDHDEANRAKAKRVWNEILSLENTLITPNYVCAKSRG